MRDGRVVLACAVAVFTTLLAEGAPAWADRKMLVLIDASGSMTTARNNSDTNGANRFEAAKKLARDRIREQINAVEDTPQNQLTVAVYTFRGTASLIPATAGFIDPEAARTRIETMTLADVGGSTPLAGAMCAAVDELVATNATTQILQVSSDGEENSTIPGTTCQGTVFPATVDNPENYPLASYQRKVWEYIKLRNSVIVRVDLFRSSQISLDAIDNPLELFFFFLAQATGGQLSVALDEQPLPVTGDLNDDRCINRDDALLIARAFGPVQLGEGRLDLNADRVIDINDYLLQASRIETTCGPDPFVPSPTIVCDTPRQIVIDGQAIASRALTIDIRSACQIVIRNSLIVSGENAITINGSAVVRVDNSIIVGPNALLGSRGTVILTAANSVFRGVLTSRGAFTLIDRGGNVFE